MVIFLAALALSTAFAETKQNDAAQGASSKQSENVAAEALYANKHSE